MTKLDKAAKMPARTLFYGFLGFVAVASAVGMLSNPLDPEVGNGSVNPSDWSLGKLQTYLSDHDIPFGNEDRRSVLAKLVKRHQQLVETEAQQARAGSESQPTTTTSPRGSATESEPLLGSQRANAENERLEHLSNVK